MSVFRRGQIICGVALLVFASKVYAVSFTESFNTTTYRGTSDMVWNLATGELHPPLYVMQWNDGVNHDTLIDVGDGHHGAFVQSRYAVFDSDGVVSGGIIEIDTDEYPNLEFTTFQLDVGFTISPVGSEPLTIRSQSDVIIDGTIECSGGSGRTVQAGNVNSSLQGGTGRCGGADGGYSVAAGQAPAALNSGGDGSPSIVGGTGGDLAVPAGGQGGGGGGSHVWAVSLGGPYANPTDGQNLGAGTAGGQGGVIRDDGFSIEASGVGSGGGGGSSYDDISTPAAYSTGGGGGAGGGFVRIYAVGNINVTGDVKADGGNGGAAAGVLRGGGGGGGGGGSIIMWAGIDVIISGSVTALGGTGGISAGGDGGDGSRGRVWLVGSFGEPAAGGVQDPVRQLNSTGDVRYETGVTYTVESDAIDLGTTRPYILTGPTAYTDPGGGGSFLYGWSFSDTPSSFPLYQLTTTFLNTAVSGYLKYTLVITNAGDGDPFVVNSDPIRIQSLGITYDNFIQDKYEFVTGCGKIHKISAAGGGGDSPLLALGISFLLLLAPIWIQILLRRQVNYHS